MTLTVEDVRRLAAAGHRDFYFETEEGELQLDNRDGRCVFLKRGLCSAYELRPEGCTLYPLVLNLDDWTVDVHDFCPHVSEFMFTREQKEKVIRLIERQEDERRQRLARK
jgi:Fe-S-cluster containining protein